MAGKTNTGAAPRSRPEILGDVLEASYRGSNELSKGDPWRGGFEKIAERLAATLAREGASPSAWIAAATAAADHPTDRPSILLSCERRDQLRSFLSSEVDSAADELQFAAIKGRVPEGSTLERLPFCLALLAEIGWEHSSDGDCTVRASAYLRDLVERHREQEIETAEECEFADERERASTAVAVCNQILAAMKEEVCA